MHNYFEHYNYLISVKLNILGGGKGRSLATAIPTTTMYYATLCKLLEL